MSKCWDTVELLRRCCLQCVIIWWNHVGVVRYTVFKPRLANMSFVYKRYVYSTKLLDYGITIWREHCLNLLQSFPLFFLSSFNFSRALHYTSMMIIREFSLHLKCGIELEIQIGISKVEQFALTFFVVFLVCFFFVFFSFGRCCQQCCLPMWTGLLCFSFSRDFWG